MKDTEDALIRVATDQRRTATLIAESNLLNTEDRLAQAHQQRAADLVSLYQGVGRRLGA